MRTGGFARGRTAAQVFRSVLFTSAAVVPVLLLTNAPSAALTFNWDNYSWFTDRTDSTHQNIGTYFGRDNALNLGVPNEVAPGYNADTFHQTVGYGTFTGLPVGNAFISGDVYIAPGALSSSANFYQSIGLWGVLGPNTATPEKYPVLQFYNGPNPNPVQANTVGSGTGSDYTGEIRGYEPNLGQMAILTGSEADPVYATDPSTVINPGAWNTLRINYIAGATAATSRFEYVLNGTVIGVINGLPGTNPAADSLYEIILNQRTNGQNGYEVYWSNIMSSMREEYYDAAAIAPAAIQAGDMLLGTYVDRRGLDWNGGKSAWMHAVAGSASLNDGNGSLSSSINGAQFGLDLLALGDPSTRIGATFGYNSQSSAVSLPSGLTGGTVSGSSPSFGGYITHADSNLYADLLAQYRFLNYTVAAPSSTGTVSGGSTDVTAETGFHFGNGAVTVTPFAQLSYQHVTLDPTTLGGMPVTFGNSDALIGRARILIQAENAGLKVFGSAGIAQDLLGAKTATVSGTTFASTLGGTRAEFTGGIEGALTTTASVFGSGEYDTSFDGKSTTYAARAGFRAGF